MDVTALLARWQDGDRDAFDQLVPLIYAELRRLASNHLRGERVGHSLRPTDLIGEAYMRLVCSAQPAAWGGRVHFFAIASRTMRQVLVDHARRRSSSKRGAGDAPATLDETIAAPDLRDLIELDRALTRLADFDERKARVVELSYFGGLSQAEIAAELAISEATVTRDLRSAEAWLHRQLLDAGSG